MKSVQLRQCPAVPGPAAVVTAAAVGDGVEDTDWTPGCAAGRLLGANGLDGIAMGC